jgi:hypothetical protein
MVYPARVTAAALVLVASSTVLPAQTTGIAACDDFLKTYEQCISTMIPDAQRAMFKGQFDQLRNAWSDMAKNPSSRANLEASCKQSAAQTKAALSNFGCTF